MPEIKGIEELLGEAYALLDEAAAEHPVGGLWRERMAAWGVESATWLTGFKGHEGVLAEVQLDPGVEGRVSHLEQGVMSLAISVAGLQTLALQGMAAPKQPTRWQMAQDLDPEGEMEILDGSKIKLKDVPLGPDGMPEEEWAMKNCPCETHNEKRRQAKGKPADPATGMYL